MMMMLMEAVGVEVVVVVERVSCRVGEGETTARQSQDGVAT